MRGDKIDGYHDEVHRHLDVGLEILAGRADAGLGIHAVAGLLNLGFVPLRWERYDLMIFKERFFDATVQQFLGLLHEEQFFKLVESLKGYDIGISGRMIYPKNNIKEELKRVTNRESGGKMRRLLVALICVVLVVCLLPVDSPAEEKLLMMATTTSTDNTGLLDYLAPKFKKQPELS